MSWKVWVPCESERTRTFLNSYRKCSKEEEDYTWGWGWGYHDNRPADRVSSMMAFNDGTKCLICSGFISLLPVRSVPSGKSSSCSGCLISQKYSSMLVRWSWSSSHLRWMKMNEATCIAQPAHTPTCTHTNQVISVYKWVVVACQSSCQCYERCRYAKINNNQTSNTHTHTPIRTEKQHGCHNVVLP